MIYALFKLVFRFVLQSYFRRIGIRGNQRIPEEGPLIFVANHPSAFMDPIVVGAFAKHPLYFIAAGEFFGNGLKSWFYRTQFNMIPVYRPSTMPGDTHKNKEMFKKCFDHLGNGGCLLVFPEGNSITEKRLRSLKTGVARMAVGACEQSGYELDVRIVPVGLNYSDPHVFRSDLFVQVGEPISIKNFDLKAEDQRALVTRITADIEKAMQNTILHISNKELDTLVEKVDQVFTPELNQIFNVSDSRMSNEFERQKEVIAAITHYQEQGEPAVQEMEEELDDYFGNLKQMGLTNHGLLFQNTSIRLGIWIRIIFGFPLFLLGWITNAFPYYLTRVIFRSLKLDESFRGSFIMAIGMGAFLLYYALILALIFIYTPWWWLALGGIPACYALGLFALVYVGWIADFREQIKFRSLLAADREAFAMALLQRKKIVEKLEHFRLAYTALRADD